MTSHTAANPRAERRIKKERPSYLNPELLNRISENADARLHARTNKRNA